MFGLNNIVSENMDLYQSVIQIMLELTFGEVRVSDLQELIDFANTTRGLQRNRLCHRYCRGEYPADISWSLVDIDNQCYQEALLLIRFHA